MSNHVFISYSAADAPEFAFQLHDELEGGVPPIDAWLDKRDIRPGRDWDDQIVEAIRTCKCMACILTKDSVARGSVCKPEWTRALTYKKALVPLKLHADVEMPLELGSRQYVDFSGGFEHGMAGLRNVLRHMASPKGRLAHLNDRLADAKRDQRRARGTDESRIKAEIEQLLSDILALQKILDNPEAAYSQTQHNIKAGLDKERQSELPTTGRVKVINPPPTVAPRHFQDRLLETKQIVDFLADDAQRLMTIVGRGGLGKTAMVCRLLRGVETAELPDQLGPLDVNGIVYLTEKDIHRATFANIFCDLCRLLPADAATDLESIYKNPSQSTIRKMYRLLDQFHDGRFILLLDNFESFLDAESQRITDSELDEALRAILGAPHHTVSVIITTRLAPRDLNLCEPGRQRLQQLDEGLPSPYAETILRELDSDGKLGLKSASEGDLGRARIKTRGYPKALEALVAILASDYRTTLNEILTIPLPENVVEALVGEAFSRLDPTSQMILKALAVFDRPISPSAVDYLLIQHLPYPDSAPTLQRLVGMHFAHRTKGKFSLHDVDREYVYRLIPTVSSPAAPGFCQHALTMRAADYFAQARKPRSEWRQLEDLAAQFAEFDLRCNAGDYDAAAAVVNEIAFDYLVLWGHWGQLISMHSQLGNLKLYANIQTYLYNLSSAYRNAGDTTSAIAYTERALALASERRELPDQMRCYWSHGVSYANTGDMAKATRYCEDALTIAMNLEDDFSQAGIRCSLANCYMYSGDLDDAIRHNRLALEIAERMDFARFKAESTFNLASCYSGQGDHQSAVENYTRAIRRADENLLLFVQCKARYGLAWELLLRRDVPNARKVIEASREFDYPRSNHDVSAMLGTIALYEGDTAAAARAFHDAVSQATAVLGQTRHFYRAAYGKALALAGLSLCEYGGASDNATSRYATAKTAYLDAILLCGAKGVRTTASRLLDTLAGAGRGGSIGELRELLAGGVSTEYGD